MEASIEHRLTEVEERSKSNTHRLDSVEKRQDDLDELVSTVKVLAVREETVESDVKEIKADVKELTSKPAKRWDGLVTVAISTIAGAIIGFVMSQLGF